MALSGVSQSHVQPVWAEIPSRSADIGAQAVPSTGPFREHVSGGFGRLNVEIILRALGYLSTVIVHNLLREPLNSTLPSPDIQVVINVNV